MYLSAHFIGCLHSAIFHKALNIKIHIFSPASLKLFAMWEHYMSLSPAGPINNKTYVDNNKPVADCVSLLDGNYVKLALI